MPHCLKRSTSNMVGFNFRNKRRKLIAAFSKGHPNACTPGIQPDNSSSDNVLKDALDNWEAFKQQQLQQLGEEKFRSLFLD